MSPSVDGDTPFYVVLNARSGSKDAESEAAVIGRTFAEAGRRHEILRVDDPASLPRVAARAVSAAEGDRGAVVAAGGDGTINAVVQAALKARRPFGIIPQGTFNYSCRAHGIPLEAAAATRALLAPVLKRVQVGLVNGRVFLVNASVGLYPELLEDRETLKQRLGRSRFVAVLAGIGTLLQEHRQLRIQFVHDGEEELIVTPSLFVGNNALQLEQAGLPEAEALERRRLAAVLLAPVSVGRLLGLAVQGALGKLDAAAEVRSFPFRTLQVTPGFGLGRNRLKAAVDGEICWMKPPVRFSVAPEPLYLMVSEADGSPP